MMLRWLALFLLLPGIAAAESIVLGLSRENVSITTSFDGSDILIFGAVKREEPIPPGPPLEIVITVTGPQVPVIVRRMERRFGIWMNADAVEVDSAPSYYAVASTGGVDTVVSHVEDLRRKITVNRVIRSVGAPYHIKDSEAFTEALIRIRRKEGSYVRRDDDVSLDEQTLFRTAIQLPASLIEGNYEIRIFLAREGRVESTYSTVLNVRKVGLERWLFMLSREQPLLYGLLSLAIAVAAGWGASAGFRILRNT